MRKHRSSGRGRLHLPASVSPGPFVASQLRSGDPYELSNGHPIECLPTGRRGSTRNLIGGSALETDPKVGAAGVDLGVSTEPGMLRAPDVAVGPIEDAPGWSPTAPPLAVEYADVGQNEDDLELKVAELLAAGTKWVWVVRLTGPRRVEVHSSGRRMQVVEPGGVLTAPGVLQNPVPIEVLYDRDAAHAATLRNLLQREGYESVDAILREGIEKGIAKGIAKGQIEALQRSILTVLRARGLAADEVAARVSAETHMATLERWLSAAAVAPSASEVVQPAPRSPKRRG